LLEAFPEDAGVVAGVDQASSLGNHRARLSQRPEGVANRRQSEERLRDMQGLPRAAHLLETDADQAVCFLVIAPAGEDRAGHQMVEADLGEVRETVPGGQPKGVADPRFGWPELACRD